MTGTEAEQVRITTARGDIVVEVMTAAAPISAVYFLEDVGAKVFDGTSFFRAVAPAAQLDDESRQIATIQGGRPWGREEALPSIAHESTRLTGLSHRAGTVSLARFAPGAVYHSFFICLRDEPALDFGGARNPDGQGFAAFGRVTIGMDVVRAIYTLAGGREFLRPEVPIRRARIVP